MFVSTNISLTTILVLLSYIGRSPVSLESSFIQDLVTSIKNSAFKGPSYSELSTANVVELQGWDVEEHDVTSEDGYITRLVRVVNPEADKNEADRDVVAIHHGIFQTAVSPTLSFGNMEASHPGKPPVTYNITDQILVSLPYYFANNDYDVWLLEARGSSKESSRHTNLSFQHSNEYWDFSLDEQSRYDLPAQIDFILNHTGRRKLAYVGYSQSSTFMFQLLSDRPDFEKKLALFAALGPVAYLEDTSGFVELVADLPGSEKFLEKFLNLQNLPPLGSTEITNFLNSLFGLVASDPVLTVTLVRALLNFTFGPDKGHNIVNVPYTSSVLHPTSSKSAGQFMQIKHSGRFAKYDFGRDENMKRYDQEKPPAYNLTNIVFDRIVLFRSIKSDYVSDRVSQERLMCELGAPVWHDYVVPEYYNHQSYFLADDSTKYVIEPLRQEIRDAFSAIRKRL